jgi:phospholipase C
MKSHARIIKLLPWLLTSALCVSCAQTDPSDEDSPADEEVGEVTSGVVVKRVFVIAMENHDASEIYGGSYTKYIQSLMTKYAYATNFVDELPALASEPHYIYMEAGKSSFPDHAFQTDGDPSASNSTGSGDHLIAQMKSAGVSWRTYQEGQSASTGDCPIHSSGFYGAKHNPFVFFRDVSGSPPSASNGYCASHSRPYSQFASDLQGGDVARYTFITPNLCHDMHGANGCPAGNIIAAGDSWLKFELPRIITYVMNHDGLIFLTFDEGENSSKIPFIAIGPGVKNGYAGSVKYDHGSMVKSIEKIFSLPTLGAVSGKNDFSDLFKGGAFP